MEVLIVGAGIAGLSTAIALSKIGMKCHVIDREFRPVGANTALNGQAVRALDKLGVLERTVAEGKVADEMAFARLVDRNGDRFPPGPSQPEELKGLPVSISIFRPNLANIMLDAARAAGATFQDDTALVNLTQTDGKAVEVELSDGTRRSYDLVVGADGVFSTTRALAFGDIPLRDTQLSIVRWVIDTSEGIVPGLYQNEQDGIAVVVTTNDATYIASTFDTPPGHEPTEQQGIEELRQSFSRFSTSTFRVLEGHLSEKSSVIVRAFKTLLLDKPWNVGRVVLVGDAAHTVTSHLAYGGGLAVEDVAVLSEEIVRTKDIDQALSAYYERRLPRVKEADRLCYAIVERQKQKVSADDIVALRNEGADLVFSPY